MKYELKSGLASYHGEPMGEKEWELPLKKKEVECALKEALEALAELEEQLDRALLGHSTVSEREQAVVRRMNARFHNGE